MLPQRPALCLAPAAAAAAAAAAWRVADRLYLPALGPPVVPTRCGGSGLSSSGLWAKKQMRRVHFTPTLHISVRYLQVSSHTDTQTKANGLTGVVELETQDTIVYVFELALCSGQ